MDYEYNDYDYGDDGDDYEDEYQYDDGIDDNQMIDEYYEEQKINQSDIVSQQSVMSNKKKQEGFGAIGTSLPYKADSTDNVLTNTLIMLD